MVKHHSLANVTECFMCSAKTSLSQRFPCSFQISLHHWRQCCQLLPAYPTVDRNLLKWVQHRFWFGLLENSNRLIGTATATTVGKPESSSPSIKPNMSNFSISNRIPRTAISSLPTPGSKLHHADDSLEHLDPFLPLPRSRRPRLHYLPHL